MNTSPEPGRAERNRQTIEEMYSLAGAGDFEGMVGLWADDVRLIEPASHPFPGTWEGKSDVQAALGGVVASLNMVGSEVVTMMAGDESVATHIKMTSTDPDGNPFEVECLEIIAIDENGKIAEIRPFYWDLIELRKRLG